MPSSPTPWLHHPSPLLPEGAFENTEYAGPPLFSPIPAREAITLLSEIVRSRLRSRCLKHHASRGKQRTSCPNRLQSIITNRTFQHPTDIRCPMVRRLHRLPIHHRSLITCSGRTRPTCRIIPSASILPNSNPLLHGPRRPRESVRHASAKPRREEKKGPISCFISQPPHLPPRSAPSPRASSPLRRRRRTRRSCLHP